MFIKTINCPNCNASIKPHNNIIQCEYCLTFIKYDGKPEIVERRDQVDNNLSMPDIMKSTKFVVSVFVLVYLLLWWLL